MKCKDCVIEVSEDSDIEPPHDDEEGQRRVCVQDGQVPRLALNWGECPFPHPPEAEQFIETAADLACEAFGVSESEFRGRAKTPRCCKARGAAAQALRMRSGMTPGQIAWATGFGSRVYAALKGEPSSAAIAIARRLEALAPDSLSWDFPNGHQARKLTAVHERRPMAQGRRGDGDVQWMPTAGRDRYTCPICGLRAARDCRSPSKMGKRFCVECNHEWYPGLMAR